MAVAVVVALAVGWAQRALAADAVPPVRRLALLVGANDGDPRLERLHYAVSDAERLARVMQQLGGVAPQDSVLLRDPTVPSLRAALADLKRRVAAARASARVEVFLYYSGHADEDGLLLRGATLPFADLRDGLAEAGGDIRVAVIDSCASGALARSKGGVPVSPFSIDASSHLTGQAILTSSSWDEVSQESDRVGGSVFTAALLAGLRGAADADHDRRVMLSEAYQFAFHETLARTERSRRGPQHPSWNLQLVGSGDVVLTDLRGVNASLVFPSEAAGHFFVRDADRRLVAELRKLPGEPLVLGLDPGFYWIVREADGRLTDLRIEVKAGSSTELPARGFSPVAREHTTARGDTVEPLEQRPLELALFPPVALNGDRPVVNRIQLALFGSRNTRLQGLGVGMLLRTDEDVSGAAVAALVTSAGEAFDGVQLAGLVSVAGEVNGAQISSIVNVARGEVRGVQLAGIANSAGPVTGLQLGLVSRSERLVGAQVGLANASARATGAQIGLVNLATDTGGAEHDGAGAVRGLQLGLVNRARAVHGLQLGLVNVADEADGVPVGLVSWVRNGEHKLLLLEESNGTSLAEVLLGSQHVHGLLRARAQRRSGGARAWLGYGLGVHLERGPFLADLDAAAEFAPDVRRGHVLVTARLLAGWQLTRWMALVAGPSGSAFWAERGFDPNLGGALRGRLGGGSRWTGLQVGLRLLP